MVLSQLDEYLSMLAKIDDLMQTLEGLSELKKAIINIDYNPSIIDLSKQLETVTIKPETQCERLTTEDWIILNPPKRNELATDYYNRYLQSGVESPIGRSMFGKAVRKAGFTAKHTNKGARYNV